jgi:hypothetical protein
MKEKSLTFVYRKKFVAGAKDASKVKDFEAL